MCKRLIFFSLSLLLVSILHASDQSNNDHNNEKNLVITGSNISETERNILNSLIQKCLEKVQCDTELLPVIFANENEKTSTTIFESRQKRRTGINPSTQKKLPLETVRTTRRPTPQRPISLEIPIGDDEQWEYSGHNVQSEQFGKLQMACLNKNLERVKKLLQQNIDINCCSYDGGNVLHTAVGCRDNLEIVTYLVENTEIDVNAKTNRSYTALMLATLFWYDENTFYYLANHEKTMITAEMIETLEEHSDHCDKERLAHLKQKFSDKNQ